MRRPLVGIVRTVLIASAALVACGGDTSFDVRYAPTYAPPRTVSVFGIFKDGRMNPESWDALGARFSAPLGGSSCEIAIGPRLVEASPSLVATLDDTTRASGVTDEILAEFAPMAKSDLIVLFTIAGRPPQPIPAGAVGRAPPSSNRFATGQRGRSGTPSSPSAARRIDRNVFEISASLYSVRTRESVGVIGMAYQGQSIEDAFRKFTEKLAAELPGTRCVGWDFAVAIDEEKLRALAQ